MAYELQLPVTAEIKDEYGSVLGTVDGMTVTNVGRNITVTCYAEIVDNPAGTVMAQGQFKAEANVAIYNDDPVKFRNSINISLARQILKWQNQQLKRLSAIDNHGANLRSNLLTRLGI